jgi:hypothetical protein
MLKYEGDMLIKETIKMTKQTFLTGIIPEEWKKKDCDTNF